MKKKIILGILTLCFATSCGSFLDEYSQNMAYVETIQDLNELLFGGAYIKSKSLSIDDEAQAGYNSKWVNILSTKGSRYPYIHLMDDDVDKFLLLNNTANNGYIGARGDAVYTWQSIPFKNNVTGLEFTDSQWNDAYVRIAVINSILYQVKEMEHEERDAELALRIEGEASFLRAQNYLWLAGMYGQPYRKATADTDLCIPLKTSAEVEDRYFTRSTMQVVYGQIVADLERSAECLHGIAQSSKYRVSQAAAYALLSRVHLYMESYQDAVECADRVLANSKYSLTNLRSWNSAISFNCELSPEMIFSQGGNLMSMLQSKKGAYYPVGTANSFRSSQDLLSQFDQGDLRADAFFLTAGTGETEKNRCIKYRNVADGGVSDIYLVRLAEVLLNKAEAQALLRLDGEAVRTLTPLLENRYMTAPTITATGNDLVNYVRNERRRELCFEGHRWFDLRRYAVNSVVPFEKEIVHLQYESNGTVTTPIGKFILKPYSQDKACYCFPIPKDEIEFNKGSLTNELRPEREMLPL